jgi:hypothetical protein
MEFITKKIIAREVLLFFILIPLMAITWIGFEIYYSPQKEKIRELKMLKEVYMMKPESKLEADEIVQKLNKIPLLSLIEKEISTLELESGNSKLFELMKRYSGWYLVLLYPIRGILLLLIW